MAHISKNPKLNSLTLGGSKDDSAILDLTSTTQGLGLPNMTEVQRDAITAPKTGLKIFNTTSAKENIYNGGVWEETGGSGSGSGTGEINFIENGDAEANAITGWVEYDNGDVAIPVDGTAGSPVNVTFSSQNTTILRGNYSFKLAKDTSNTARGEGVSYDFAVDKSDQDTKLKIEFDYATGGSYLSNYVSVYIYDVDNSTLITPKAINLPVRDIAGDGSDKFSTTFQSTDSLNYRLLIHVATGAIGTFDVYLDNVLVGIADEAVGPVNYITNSSAESGSFGWSTYKDTAGVLPVDGTGGGPITVTYTSQDVTVLRGTKSFKLTKSGSNLQGEGASYDFTVDKADQNKLLGISFDYNTDGTYTAGDVAVYIYDVDTATLITPRVTEITGYDKDSDGSSKFVSDFSPADVSSTNYRLILHTVDATTNVWDLYVDNITVGPGTTVQGANIGPWIDFTPTGSWTGGTNTGAYRRVGDSVEFYAVVASPSAWGGNIILDEVPNLTFDSSVIGTTSIVGTVDATDTSANTHYTGSAVPTGIGGFYVIGDRRVSVWAGSGAVPFAWAATADRLTFKVTYPVAEWAGTGTVNLINDDLVKQNARFSVSGLTAVQAITKSATTEIVNWNTADVLSGGGSFDGTSYVVPADGVYTVHARQRWTGTVTGTEYKIYIYVDGVVSTTNAESAPSGDFYPSNQVTATLDLIKGEEVSIFVLQNFGAAASTTDLRSAADESVFSVTRIPDYTAGQAVGFGLADADNAGLVSRESFTTLDISSSGDYSAAQPNLRIARVGHVVTLTSPSLTHTFATSGASAAGFIPVEYRPTHGVSVVSSITSTTPIRQVAVASDGTLTVSYLTSAFGGDNESETQPFTLSWVID